MTTNSYRHYALAWAAEDATHGTVTDVVAAAWRYLDFVSADPDDVFCREEALAAARKVSQNDQMAVERAAIFLDFLHGRETQADVFTAATRESAA